MKAKIWCEVTCGRCGKMATDSGYYHNKLTIALLKEEIKDWEYTEDYGNLCPECLREMRKKNEKHCS